MILIMGLWIPIIEGITRTIPNIYLNIYHLWMGHIVLSLFKDIYRICIYIYGKNRNYTLSIPNIQIYSSYLDGTYYLLNYCKILGDGT
jgi:hypothetical protein